MSDGREKTVISIMKPIKKNRMIITMTAALLLCLWLALPAVSFAASGSLKICVGYAGGPFYEKKTFSAAEVENMGTERHVYSYIDRSPAVVLDCATGVRLSTVISSAGIDSASVKRFYFFAGDGYDPDWESTASNLLSTTRYYYPGLLENYTPQNGAGKNASRGAVAVPTMLAVTDDWSRYSVGENFTENWNDQKTANRFRLMFGQTAPSEAMADKSVKLINKVDVVLEGSPSIAADKDTITGKVGTKTKINITVNAADSLVASQIKKNLKWSTENSKVAAVDSSGNVTVTGKGSTVITARSGDSEVSVIVNGKKKGSSGSGSGGGSGSGTGGGSGRGSGSGAGSSGSSSSNATQVVLGKSGKINAQKAGSGNGSATVYEMDKVNNELPKSEENKYLLQVCMIVGGILLASMGGEAIAFRRKLRG